MQLKVILAGAVISLLVLRLAFAWNLPLEDEAEARFAELARLMDDTQNPLVPRSDYDGAVVPQPLAVWLSALALRFFGAAEVVPRAPHFLLGMLVLGCCWQFARRQGLAAGVVPILLIAMPLFWLALGRTGADMPLLLAMCLVCFTGWNLQHRRNPDDSMVLGLGLAMGLLAAGPVMLLITVPAITVPVILHRRVQILMRNTHWPWLCLGLSLAPLWYLAVISAGIVTRWSQLWSTPAEFSSLKGVTGWTAAVAVLLWLVVLASARPNLRGELPTYLVCWTLAPVLILGLEDGGWSTAALLAAPPLALLAATREFGGRWLARLVPLVPLVPLVVLPLVLLPSLLLPASGSREMLLSTQPLRQVLLFSPPSSAEEYYSRGRARQVAQEDLPIWVEPGRDFYLLTTDAPPPRLDCQYQAASARRQLHLCQLPEE